MIRAYAVKKDLLHPVEGLEGHEGEIVWADLMEPTREEELAIENWVGVDIPTREEMEEIEASSRLYTENGAFFMTAILPANTDGDKPQMSPVTFVLSGGRLVTIRYHEPQAFRTFPTHAEKAALGCTDGQTVLLGLLEVVVDGAAQRHVPVHAASTSSRWPESTSSICMSSDPNRTSTCIWAMRWEAVRKWRMRTHAVCAGFACSRASGRRSARMLIPSTWDAFHLGRSSTGGVPVGVSSPATHRGSAHAAPDLRRTAYLSRARHRADHAASGDRRVCRSDNTIDNTRLPGRRTNRLRPHPNPHHAGDRLHHPASPGHLRVASQAEVRGFEPRRPLHESPANAGLSSFRRCASPERRGPSPARTGT